MIFISARLKTKKIWKKEKPHFSIPLFFPFFFPLHIFSKVCVGWHTDAFPLFKNFTIVFLLDTGSQSLHWVRLYLHTETQV